MNPSGALMRRVIHAIGATTALVMLSACQVDLTTTLTMTENGSGTISVVATADAEAVRLAPELETSLQLEDLQQAGWTTDVQSLPTGGLSATVSRNFATPDEATLFMSQLSGVDGPLRDVAITRTGGINDAQYELNGVGGLPNGLAGFADSQALIALGAAPFAAALAERGGTLNDSLSMSLVLTLPGEPLELTAIVTPRQADDLTTTFTWQIPVDQTEVVLAAATRDRNISALLAWYASRIFLVLLILLAVIIVLYVATVVYRRSTTTPAS